jgi:hypothetical protein
MSHTLSTQYAAPLRLELGPSRALAAWLIVVHASPLALLPLLHLPLWLNLAISATVLCGLFDAWRRRVRRGHPDAVRTVLWKEAGHCQLILNSGQQRRVSLAAQAFILPWMVVLHFKTPQRRLRYLLVLSDMLDDETFRRLRVRLRIEIDQGAA